VDGLDVRASAQVDAGPAVEADVGWKPDVLDVRSVHIKDAESDATLGLLTRGRLLDIRFSGVLTGRSFAGLFAQSAGEHPGARRAISAPRSIATCVAAVPRKAGSPGSASSSTGCWESR
jgi:hypothetical protein